MKIGIYPAALAVMGGGEKYIGKIAEILSNGNDVSFLVLAKPDVQALEAKLNIGLSRVSFENIRTPLSRVRTRVAAFSNLINTYEVSRLTKKYDLFINQEHMTFIPSCSRRGILVCEVPPVRPSLVNRLLSGLFFDPRIKTYDKIVVNSHFTRKWAEKYYCKEATVLYPPIDTKSFVPSAKENIILSVGRFCTVLHCKKQLEMVNAFKKLYREQNLKGWTYHLIGGLGSSARDHKYLEDCKEEGEGYPVYFHVNATLETLKELYGKAKIFWHATGLGEDEREHPELMEHFGITTVEAMSAGCVPVVINKGGQPEIVKNGISGFLFDNEEGLNKYTMGLVSDDALLKKMSEECIERSSEFSLEKFEARVKEIFGTET